MSKKKIQGIFEDLVQVHSQTFLEKLKKNRAKTLIRKLKEKNFSFINLLTPKISLVILLTVFHVVLLVLVWRIWYWIN